MDIYGKVKSIIISNGLIKEGDRVLVGVSGGADSVVLLHILQRFQRDSGSNFSLECAHFNHELRDDADNDCLFVKELCKKIGLSFFEGSGNVKLFSRENGYTEEQAGRIMRYSFFRSLCCDKIAVAHHKNDQAESVLMHIIRGSGTAGICGMSYASDDIIRPLLAVSRKEIELYAANNSLKYVTDQTNLIPGCTRNRLRLEVIPYIEKNINSGFTDSVCSLSELVSKDEEFLLGLAKKALSDCSEKAVKNGYNRKKLLSYPYPVLSRAIRLALSFAGAVTDVERKSVVSVIEFMKRSEENGGDTGKRIDLPHSICYNSYENVIFATNQAEERSFTEITLSEPIYGNYSFDNKPLVIESCSQNNKSRDKESAYVDEDKLLMLDGELKIRGRMTGDLFTNIGNNTKKLKDFLIDKKIPREKRGMPLITKKQKVLVILGEKIYVSEQVKTEASTKRILKITYGGKSELRRK